MSSLDLRDDVRRWLAEDVGWGDVTTERCVSANAQSSGRFVARQPGVLSGLQCAAAVFVELDVSVVFTPIKADGDAFVAGDCLATVAGSARALLTGERLALNLMQRLSAVASLTRQFVDRVAGTGVKVLDTRKTTPGLRRLEKAAVRDGGGCNHRFGLSDGILIKDNHLIAAGGVAPAIAAARAGNAMLSVEVEVDTLEQLAEALAAGADGVLLDNMGPEKLSEAVKMCRGHAWTEASGGVNLKTVRAIAESGVDYVSVGALTHSAPAVDIGLDFNLA